MERNFTNDEFERFLQRNAEGLRMRPSDDVWKSINKKLNRKRRRVFFFLSLSLLVSTSLGYYLIENPKAPASGMQIPANETDNRNTEDITRTTQPAENITARGLRRTTAADRSAMVVPIDRNSSAASSPTNTFSSFNQPGFTLNQSNTNFADEGNVSGAKLIAMNGFVPTPVDSYSDADQQETKTIRKESSPVATDPLTIESVLNAYKPGPKRKLGLQYYFTPTVSYRRLAENKTFTRTAAASGYQPSLYNINNAVTHKPDFGFQIGVTAKYMLSPKIKLRGGIQFNVNRYDIKTFNSSYEVATIQFRDRQTLNAVTGYNNFSGYKSDWLENFYFGVSAPLGVEMKLSGNERTHFGVAATIQPTYLIGDKAYLISKDYKNYIEVPSLVRPWNVNSSIETFVSYSAGRMQWQVGPQIRYQLLSSYDRKYPVKEHLFDFGLRVGLSINK